MQIPKSPHQGCSGQGVLPPVSASLIINMNSTEPRSRPHRGITFHIVFARRVLEAQNGKRAAFVPRADWASGCFCPGAYLRAHRQYVGNSALGSPTETPSLERMPPIWGHRHMAWVISRSPKAEVSSYAILSTLGSSPSPVRPRSAIESGRGARRCCSRARELHAMSFRSW